MNTENWMKKTNIKLFGVKIFEKEQIFTEQNYECEIMQVNITQDYYNKEFKVDNKKDDNC